MTAYLYPISLAAISALVFALERYWPWRPEQKQLRPGLLSDALHLVFNAHFLGILLAGLADTWVLPHVDRSLSAHGMTDSVYRNAAHLWPLWLQVPVALVVIDFIQWCVHNLLHRVPFLWPLHKAHHSVKDGEMDWIVSFRFSWLEVIVYKSVLYLPMVFLGFRWEALMVHAVFGTLIGHLNHANLNLGHGRLRYLLNSPRMHIWHHDYDGDARTTVNFGIIFSTWDWLFGTAKMPEDPPAALGFDGVESFPTDFLGQEIWPLQRLAPQLKTPALWSVAGALVMAGAWYLHEPHAPRPATPMLGEGAAASQPTGITPPADAYAASPAQAAAALSRFGRDAKRAGYAHPEVMVSSAELARALGAGELVLLDVRPMARFAAGHIPGARRVDRPDYSDSQPVPGLSRDAGQLQALMRARGVGPTSTVVLYGDGGPEPYRLWWTLRQMADHDTRVLDGGLQAWKAAGHYVAGGNGTPPAKGTLSLTPPAQPPTQNWAGARAFLAAHPEAVVLDSRSAAEFSGRKQHRKAARAGRIPQARHMDWTGVMRDATTDHRLLDPAALGARFASVGVQPRTPVLTYCQSGTRSAALYFALYQLGHGPAGLHNYDGSWAEYSRDPRLAVAP